MNTNVCVFTGRLIKTALLDELPNGNHICNFCIAVDEGTTDKHYTNFVSCSVYGKYAESIVNFLKKGVEVTVTCRLHQNRWENEKGKFNSYIFYADNIMLQRTPKEKKEETATEKTETKKMEEVDAEIEQNILY